MKIEKISKIEKVNPTRPIQRRNEAFKETLKRMSKEKPGTRADRLEITKKERENIEGMER